VCKSANVSSNYRNSGIIIEENGKLGAVLGTPERRDCLYVTIQSGTNIVVYFVFLLTMIEWFPVTRESLLSSLQVGIKSFIARFSTRVE
jgi:hypothetical protein